MRFGVAKKDTGYWGIGVWHSKTEVNIGTLMRSAHSFGASFVFTVGRRYEAKASDISKATRHIPCYHYKDMDDLVDHLPLACPIVGIELHPKAKPLDKLVHPFRACYLLGAEDHGLQAESLEKCHMLTYIPHGKHCLNVATAGSIVMYDRMVKACA